MKVGNFWSTTKYPENGLQKAKMQNCKSFTVDLKNISLKDQGK